MLGKLIFVQIYTFYPTFGQKTLFLAILKLVFLITRNREENGVRNYVFLRF